MLLRFCSWLARARVLVRIDWSGPLDSPRPAHAPPRSLP